MPPPVFYKILSAVCSKFARPRNSRDGKARLKNRLARLAIAKRIDRLAAGHFGDVKPVGEGVQELRIHLGPGYRVYFVQQSGVVIVLLCGGDKKTRTRDIEAAKTMARDLKD